MKKLVAIACSITLALSPVTAYGAEMDGDVCENPWSDIFTTQNGTTQETTTQSGNQQSSTQVKTTNGTVNTVTTKKPGKTKIRSIKKKSLKVVLTLKKVKNIKGYQVQYSTSKKFKKNKKTTTKKVNSTKTKITLKKLTNKKYYVRARTYIVVNKKKVYSKWSKKKTVKK